MSNQLLLILTLHTSYLKPHTASPLQNNIAASLLTIDHKLPTFTTLNQVGDMENQQFDFGMIGLGVVGRNLLLNLDVHGFKVIGYNKSREKLDGFKADTARGPVVSYLSKHRRSTGTFSHTDWMKVKL